MRLTPLSHPSPSCMCPCMGARRASRVSTATGGGGTVLTHPELLAVRLLLRRTHLRCRRLLPKHVGVNKFNAPCWGTLTAGRRATGSSEGAFTPLLNRPRTSLVSAARPDALTHYTGWPSRALGDGGGRACAQHDVMSASTERAPPKPLLRAHRLTLRACCWRRRSAAAVTGSQPRKLLSRGRRLPGGKHFAFAALKPACWHPPLSGTPKCPAKPECVPPAPLHRMRRAGCVSQHQGLACAAVRQ